MTPEATPGVLSVRDLEVRYRRGRERVTAVSGVSFDIRPGEALGLVGESGSGKSTIGLAVLGLVPISRGTITFEGEPQARLSRRQWRDRGARLSVIFQDPYSSLDPTKTVGYSLMEPALVQSPRAHRAAQERAVAMLDRVGLAADAAERYPAQFSGGQRQRIAIARALMLSPSLVVCDEPVSALDLSIQAEVMNLLVELKAELDLSLLFISHDLSVVRFLCDRLVVLRHGAVVEEGDADAVYESPRDPYTRALLAAAPVPDPREQRARSLARRSTATS